MKRLIAGLAFTGILLASGCGLRYEVKKPPSIKKKVVSLRPMDLFRKTEPLDDLPLPKALQKKPEARFITLDSENRSGDRIWLNSKER